MSAAREAAIEVQVAPGAALKGRLVEVNRQFHYGYVALEGDPERQFIVSMAPYPDIGVGREVEFKLDAGLAVASMAPTPEAEPIQEPGARAPGLVR